jgi:hypothetical protein
MSRDTQGETGLEGGCVLIRFPRSGASFLQALFFSLPRRGGFAVALGGFTGDIFGRHPGGAPSSRKGGSAASNPNLMANGIPNELSANCVISKLESGASLRAHSTERTKHVGTWHRLPRLREPHRANPGRGEEQEAPKVEEAERASPACLDLLCLLSLSNNACVALDVSTDVGIQLSEPC